MAEGDSALEGYRVLDLADRKGVYCTKVLADLGADVIKVESPQGDPSRNTSPFAGDIPHPERSLYFLYRNANKRGITLNLESSDGRGVFRRLVKSADILVETFPPGYMDSLGLGYPALREINSRLIMASITEFGHSGPYKDYKGSDIVEFAMSGGMFVAGFPDKAPCTVPGSLAADSAAIYAGVAIMAALWNRAATGEGQYIDISTHEAAHAAIYPWELPTYSYSSIVPGTPAINPRAGGGVSPIYACKDGYIRINAGVPRHWNALVEWMGSPEVLLLPEWQDGRYRRANQDILRPLTEEFTAKFTMAELFYEGQRRGIPVTPVYTPVDFFHDTNIKAREYFVEVEHPLTSKAFYPGAPYKMTETPPRVRRPAPLLGQHNGEVYCNELGFSSDELAALKRGGVI